MTLHKFCTRILLAHAAVFFLTAAGLSVAQPPNFQPPPADKRAEIRSYHFSDTNEEMPYALYVSSRVKPEEKALSSLSEVVCKLITHATPAYAQPFAPPHFYDLFIKFVHGYFG